jgi:predicted transcriptional regulator of viral defense system
MKRKSKNNLLETLKSLPYFTKERIYQLGKDEKSYNLKNSSINTYISRFLKNKDIVPLKRGLYISTDFYNASKKNISYTFFLANIIRKPSYVSSWTALQYYNLTTEIIHTVISVTPKVTRNYRTKINTFSYQSIKEDLFSDFHLIKDPFEFFIASPSKALFDLLYFKTKRFRGMKLDDINYIIEELRIDIDEMNIVERNKFYSMISNYIRNE